MIPLLAGAALAASTAGFRLGPRDTAPFAAARQVLVLSPEGANVWQVVPRLRLGGPRYSLEVEVPLYWSWAEGWASADRGLLVGNRFHLGEREQVALGLELYEPSQGPWGSLSREATGGGLWIVEVFPRPGRGGAAYTLRFGLGFVAADGPLLDFEAAAAGVLPLREGWALVVEGEFAAAESPIASLRSLLRWTPAERWSLDLGAQAPLAHSSIAEIYPTDPAPSVQLIGQVSRSLPPLARPEDADW